MADPSDPFYVEQRSKIKKFVSQVTRLEKRSDDGTEGLGRPRDEHHFDNADRKGVAEVAEVAEVESLKK